MINFTTDNLHDAFLKLMHNGIAWSKSEGTNTHSFTRALMPTFERAGMRSNALVAEANPATTHELMPEWEESLGLPDPCQGPAPSLAARKAQIKARFCAQGGQSIPYLKQYAADLGFPDIEIVEFSPTHSFSNAFLDQAPEFVLKIIVPTDRIIYFRSGESYAGDHLQEFPENPLECEFRRIVGAHIALLFEYITD